MLVSHDVQLNSKSIIENSFGQLLCRHRECVCVCGCVHTRVSNVCPTCGSVPPRRVPACGGDSVVTAKPDQQSLLPTLPTLCSASPKLCPDVQGVPKAWERRDCRKTESAFCDGEVSRGMLRGRRARSLLWHLLPLFLAQATSLMHERGHLSPHSALWHQSSRDQCTNMSPQSPTTLLATAIPRSNGEDVRDLRTFSQGAFHTSLSSNCTWEEPFRTCVASPLHCAHTVRCHQIWGDNACTLLSGHWQVRSWFIGAEQWLRHWPQSLQAWLHLGWAEQRPFSSGLEIGIYDLPNVVSAILPRKREGQFQQRKL